MWLIELHVNYNTLTSQNFNWFLQGPAGAYVDLKDILETWRLRTPNEWDELTIWMDLLQWRNHMYNTVINAFKGFSETNPQLHQLGFRDKAWSVNKLAYVARRQGLYEVCVSVLNKMYGFLTMEVQVRVSLLPIQI
jgi:transformation/transcription domain-associated protein